MRYINLKLTYLLYLLTNVADGQTQRRAVKCKLTA